MFGFVIVTEDGIKLGIVEKTDLGYLIGSSEISRDKNLDVSIDGILKRRNYIWKYWWFIQWNMTGKIICS